MAVTVSDHEQLHLICCLVSKQVHSHIHLTAVPVSDHDILHLNCCLVSKQVHGHIHFTAVPVSDHDQLHLICCLVSKQVPGQVHLTALPVSDFKTGSRYCSSDCCPSIWSWPTSPKLLPGLKTGSWSHSWSCSSDCCAIPNTRSWCCFV